MGLRFFAPLMLGGTSVATDVPATPQKSSCFDAAFASIAKNVQAIFGNEVELEGDLVTVIHDENSEVIVDSETGLEFERLTVYIDKSLLEVPKAGLSLVRKNLPNDRAFRSSDEWFDEGDEWRMVFLRSIPRQFGTENFRETR